MERIDELSAALDPAPELAVVACPSTLDQEAVIARHMKLFPVDRKAKRLVVLWQANDNPDYRSYRECDRIDGAWRQIAREEQATIAPDDLRLLHGRRRLHDLAMREMPGRDLGMHIGGVIAEHGIPESEALAPFMSRSAEYLAAVRGGIEAVRGRI